MNLQRSRKTIRGGPGHPGSLAQFGQPARRFRDRVQHDHGFVEDADAAMLSHKEILASRILRSSERAAIERIEAKCRARWPRKFGPTTLWSPVRGPVPT